LVKNIEKQIKVLISKDKAAKADLSGDNAYFEQKKIIRLSTNSWLELNDCIKKGLLKSKSEKIYKAQLSKNKQDLLLQALNNLRQDKSSLYHHITTVHNLIEVEVKRIITLRVLKKREVANQLLYRFEWHIARPCYQQAYFKR
jgi:hypothetical protein